MRVGPGEREVTGRVREWEVRGSHLQVPESQAREQSKNFTPR